eukprot:387711_1
MNEQRQLFKDIKNFKVIRSGAISRLDYILVIKTTEKDSKLLHTFKFIIGNNIEIVMPKINVNHQHQLKNNNTKNVKQKKYNNTLKKRKELLQSQRQRIWDD